MRTSIKVFAGLFVAIILACCCVSVVNCAQNNEELIKTYINSEDTEEIWHYGESISKLGKDGIPIYLEALNKAIKNKWVLNEFARITASIKYLNDLAAKGTFIYDEVPVLVNTLKNIPHINDAPPIADILSIITGVPQTITQKYAESYTVEDSEAFKAEIAKYEVWWEENKARLGQSEKHPR